MSKEQEEEDSHCTFCGRDYSETGGIISSPSGARICERCSNVSSLIFLRRKELTRIADASAMQALRKGQMKNSDGTCNCPTCTLIRMIECDEVMQQLAHVGDEVEANNPYTSPTRH